MSFWRHACRYRLSPLFRGTSATLTSAEQACLPERYAVWPSTGLSDRKVGTSIRCSAAEAGDESGTKHAIAMPIWSRQVPSLLLLNRRAVGGKSSFRAAVETSTVQRNPVITGASRIVPFWHAACDVSG